MLSAGGGGAGAPFRSAASDMIPAIRRLLCDAACIRDSGTQLPISTFTDTITTHHPPLLLSPPPSHALLRRLFGQLPTFAYIRKRLRQHGVVQGSGAPGRGGDARAGAGLLRPGWHMEQQVELDLHRPCTLHAGYFLCCAELTGTARTSTTQSRTTSPSPSTLASATHSPPTAISKNHTTALSQTVRNTQTCHVLQHLRRSRRRNTRTPIANARTATNPKCPKGIIQWQHGKFEKLADGSLKLHPIKVDGRQMYSDPCEYSTSVYTRYNATETFQAGTLPPPDNALSF